MLESVYRIRLDSKEEGPYQMGLANLVYKMGDELAVSPYDLPEPGTEHSIIQHFHNGVYAFTSLELLLYWFCRPLREVLSDKGYSVYEYSIESENSEHFYADDTQVCFNPEKAEIVRKLEIVNEVEDYCRMLRQMNEYEEAA